MSLGLAIQEGIIAGNVGLSMYFGLTEGAARLIESFGSAEMNEVYTPRMISGEFTGTMCLSEPQAGSDVGACYTTAEPTGDGRYKIKGTKCWISSGDNNLGKNVIHTVLARLKGAPEGTRGLSLFLVPSYQVNEDGSVGESNDVTLASLEHKMGINCSSTAVLNFGENSSCYGYLLGEENKGMAHMFQMMNEARMGTAAIGLATSSAAYQNALDYAKERVQGVHINQMKQADAEKVAIVEHPNVRMYLMTMKSTVEAIRALLYAATNLCDIATATTDEKERQHAEDIFQVLTPMCKGWATEAGIDVVRTGIQVLGGVGYTKDFPLEQYYRDLRISAIYEGTTGIQALDLVGRKMTMRNGELFMKLVGQFNELAESQKEHPVLGSSVGAWARSCEKMVDMSMRMQGMIKERGMAGPALYATPLLMFISAVTAGYYYIEQGLVASKKLEALKQNHLVTEEGLDAFLNENSDARFYDNKLKSIHFYTHVLLPHYEAHSHGVAVKDYTALDIRF